VRGISWNSSSNNVWGASPDITDVEWCGLTPGLCTTWTWSDAPFDVHVVGGQPFVMLQSSGLYRCSSQSDCSQATATQVSTWGQESFADDGTNVFFADTGSYVYYCPVSGCGTAGPIKLSPSSGFVQDLTTDAKFLYWITSTGGVYKVGK
jgi:plastocyanin